MAYITYNQQEVIFLGLFFGILIIAFIVMFVYPSESKVMAELKDVKKELGLYYKKKNSRTKKPPRKDPVPPPKGKKLKTNIG